MTSRPGTVLSAARGVGILSDEPAGPARGTVAVMARPLVRGAVKTPPRASLGDEGALAVYERLLGGTLDAAEQVARRRARAGGGAAG